MGDVAAKADKEKAEAEKAAKESAEKIAKEEAARKAAEERVRTPPAPLAGTLSKKSKGGLFRKAWDTRYGVVKDGTFAYYREKKEVGKVEPARLIDFRPCHCEAVIEPTDRGGTQLILRPRTGNWTGQNFRGADEDRDFVFDTSGSEHPRSAWI